MEKKSFYHPKSIWHGVDYQRVADLVEPNSHILDLGCGNGELLTMLAEQKNVTGQGIEIDEERVVGCLQNGVPVIMRDIDEGLYDFPDQSFDYVVLNQTLHVVKKPVIVMKEMLRIGRKAIVSFPNFANISNRFQIYFRGVMPKTKYLPYEWYNTPNIHLFSLKDFKRFCKAHSIAILKEYCVSLGQIGKPGSLVTVSPNLLAQFAVFKLARGAGYDEKTLY